MAILVILLID